MRILAVAQILDLDALPIPSPREGSRAAALIACGQVVADRAVVGRRVRERLLRQPEARRRRERAAAFAKLGEQRRVVRRIDDDTDVRVILCRCAHQGRSADVDVLDGILQAAVWPGDRLAERIEIDDDQVDRWDAVLGERCAVRSDVAPGEDAGVHLGMQRLDAPVEHFRESRVGADLSDRQSRVGKRTSGAAGGEQTDAERRKAPREIDEPGLIRDRQQCLGDWRDVHLSDLPASGAKADERRQKPFKSRRERRQSAARGGEEPECTR